MTYLFGMTDVSARTRGHRRGRSLALLMTVLLMVLGPALVSPASAAVKPKVTMSMSKKVAAPNTFITFKGSVSKNSAGAKVRLERRDATKWVPVKSAKVSKSKKYSIKARIVVGKHNYRVRVLGNKKVKTAYSAKKPARGKAVALQPFTVMAQLRSFVPRRGTLHVKMSGEWVKVKSFTTSSKGVAKVPTILVPGARVRFHLPATQIGTVKYADWTSPSAKVAAPSTSSSAQERILSDINKFRAKNGKPQLKLDSRMSGTAEDWSKRMHDTGKFEHRSDLSAGLSGGWTRLGENIAAGYTAKSVVKGWENSPGHRANMLGDFSRIGIGYYEGSKGFKTYFTTIHAKY